jgi:aspartate/methionine/tyrosine aminotransferase
MTYRINGSIGRVVAPPIAEAREWVRGRRFPEDMPLIDLAQAVPGYPPPAELTRRLAELVDDPETHRYTDIEGLPPLRMALARHMSDVYRTDIAADRVCITAGCNQAFCLAVMALAGYGDEVLLPLPYYFNHQMWLQSLGIAPIYLPFDAERGGTPDAAAANSRVTERTRAIVLVSPNNPTGAVYPPSALKAFYDLAKARGIALIVDETYKDFLPTEDRAHALFDDPNWGETFVQLYSFSKVYCLTGYRVGSIVAGRRLLDQVAKAMDCVAICAPRIGQEAALYGLCHLQEFRAKNAMLMRERVAGLKDALRQRNTGYELVSIGAYFAYLRHPFDGEPAHAVARRLADAQNILCLPGSMFGPQQEPFLRFAFANAAADRFPDLVDRLAASARA